MSTATAEAVDSLHATMEPMESLHGEHSQLEGWVHDSFAALEKLHSELTEWQSELARKQTELDLREDAVMRSESQTVSGDAEEQIAHWQHELSESRDEIQQVEQENAEQLQELEHLELSLVQMEKELQDAHKRTLDLDQMLEVERTRSTEEQRQWQGEFRDMRRLMEKQSSLLENRIRDARDATEDEGESSDGSHQAESNGEAISRTAEWRRRAKARLAAKLRRHQEETDSDASSES
jgi:chromosome segregation ATPase